MLMFVCIFLPPIISVMLYEKITKSNMVLKQWGYLYAVSAVITNLFSWLYLRVREGIYLFESYAADTLIKYMLLSLFASVIFSMFAALLKKTVKIRVEENEEK